MYYYENIAWKDIVDNFWAKKQKNANEIIKDIQILKKQIKEIKKTHRDTFWNNLNSSIEENELINRIKWTIEVLNDLKKDFIDWASNIAVNNISKYYHSLFKIKQWWEIVSSEVIPLKRSFKFKNFDIKSYLKVSLKQDLNDFNKFYKLVILDWSVYELNWKKLEKSKNFKLNWMELEYIWEKSITNSIKTIDEDKEEKKLDTTNNHKEIVNKVLKKFWEKNIDWLLLEASKAWIAWWVIKSKFWKELSKHIKNNKHFIELYNSTIAEYKEKGINTSSIFRWMLWWYFNSKAIWDNYESFVDLLIKNDIEFDKWFVSSVITGKLIKQKNTKKLSNFINKYWEFIDYQLIRDQLLDYPDKNDDINLFITEYYNKLKPEQKKEFDMSKNLKLLN